MRKMGIAVLLIGIVIFIYGCKDKSEKVIRSVKKNLPIGTSFAEVEAYLKKTNFEYSYDRESKCFTAILRDVSKNALTSTSISVVIKMDEHDKLKALDIKTIGTGP